MTHPASPAENRQFSLSAVDETLRAVEVRASSRLHFGLFSWGGAGRQFGGIGAMVRDPGLRVTARRAPRFEAEGPLAERIHEFCERWTRHHQLPDMPPLHWQSNGAADQHVGLGTGTQLGLAVAAACLRFHGVTRWDARQLALSVGRGLRSAIGAYGFVLGGLIVEPGKLPAEPLSPLGCRVPIPDTWRIVLIRPRIDCGLHGAAERRAFATLPPVPEEKAQRLEQIARERIVPAASEDNFASFSESLWEYGALAGSCFAPVQGGPFNGPVVTQLVHCLRDWGVVGVGQSSWGPTLFTFLPNEAAALELRDRLERDAPTPVDTVITVADNQGAQVCVRG